MIQENLKAAFTASKLYVKEIAAKSGVNKSTIDGWMSARAYEPRPTDLYAVCKVINITMEQALDGDTGVEYVREIVRNDPGAIQVPDRIASIVENLLFLDEKELKGIRANVEALAADKKGTGQKTGTDDLPG
jgi:transcriptional regulator with XRE-family HTH domain